MAFISVTRLRVRHAWFLPSFMFRTTQALRQAQAAAGNHHVGVLRDVKWTFWTMTSWESEVAMRNYILAGPHRKVMHKLLDWCDEASLVHWTQENFALPEWREAHRRMLAEGRTSKVRHPTVAQRAFDVPAPLVDVTRSVMFK